VNQETGPTELVRIKPADAPICLQVILRDVDRLSPKDLVSALRQGERAANEPVGALIREEVPMLEKQRSHGPMLDELT